MYFVKARKHLDDLDANDRDKSNRNRYQRSADSARLLLSAAPSASQQAQASQSQHELNQVPGLGIPGAEFRLEELPDGACYRPKKEILMNSDRPLSPAAGIVGTGTAGQIDSTADYCSERETLRPAEYIGTFSVSGSDKQAREKQMEIQLQQMRNVSAVTPVNLLISVEGVKVINFATQCPIMEHSLKRIWYATCDPEYCQFSFLAREPKTSAEVQYCHAFLTKTSQEAEELISLMGNAFKATVPLSSTTSNSGPTKRQPTFHELIEQQVQEQQAKFREIEKESKLALQRKLTEIATPTPFSEKAQQRIGSRRFSDGGGLETSVNTDKMWAKQLISQSRNEHIMSDNSNFNNNTEVNRRSEIPIPCSSPQSSPFKRNSVPPQVRENISGSNPSSVPSSPAHPLSALAIRESLGSKQSSSKFKGSPVTALKNEIDKRLLIDETLSFPVSKSEVIQPSSHTKDKSKSSMANRPLPSPPEESAHEPRGRSRNGRRGADSRVRRSLDDNNLPMNPEGQVKMRNSPRRGQSRPMSEIVVGSSSAQFHQQRQSLLQNFPSSFNSPSELEAAVSGATSGNQDKFNLANNRNSSGNIYIPTPHQLHQPVESVKNKFSNHNSPSKVPTRTGQVERRERSGSSDGGRKRSDAALPPLCPLQMELEQTEMYEELIEEDGGTVVQLKPLPANNMTDGTGIVEFRQYQNGSPFYQGDHDDSGPSWGLESLMNLDRSHIHDITLRNSPWYQAGLQREIALDILQQEEVGAFIVRDSSTHPGCFALSVRVPRFENSSGISHYLIMRTHRGVKLKGLDKEWSNLHALVIHHTVMREMLPCTLRLPRATPPLSNDIGSSCDGMERREYTDMAPHSGGSSGMAHHPALKVVGGENF